MGRVIGSDFVGLQVRDLAASRRFYEESLGLAVAPQSPPGAVVFLSDPIPFAVREPDVDLDAVERLGWGVALWMRCEDADGLCAALEEDGVEISQPPFDGPFGQDVRVRGTGRLHRDRPRECLRGAGVSGQSFEIVPEGPYSFAQSVRFLEGFAPAAYEGGDSECLRLAFVADGGDETAGAELRSEGGAVVGEVYGNVDSGVVRSQVGRILSLDVDGSGFAGVGERDAVVGRLQRRYPGLRPVLFYSPYEAAAWAIIGNRIRIPQAAKIKARMAMELGEAVEVAGKREHAFPGPSRLSELEDFPGLSGRKAEYLRRLGLEASEGKLDAERLRAMPVTEALADLKELPGIGGFSAELVLLRGAGEPDHLPVEEPRLAWAVALAYELDEPPGVRELTEIAEGWRPYRTWVSVYLRAMLEEETGEISGGAKKSEHSSR